MTHDACAGCARRGLPLAAAIYGILATALIAGGLLLAPVTMSSHRLLGAIVLLALWYGALALLVGTRAIAHPVAVPDAQRRECKVASRESTCHRRDRIRLTVHLGLTRLGLIDHLQHSAPLQGPGAQTLQRLIRALEWEDRDGWT